MRSQNPALSYYLDTPEKQAVFVKYSFVKLKKNYAECLQKFIFEEFRKQVSWDYIHKLVSVSRKRSRKVNIKKYLIDATQAAGFDWEDTFRNQCQFCIAYSSEIAEAVSGGEVTEVAMINHLRNLGKAHGCLPRYKRRHNVESAAEHSGAPISSSDVAAHHIELIVELRDVESLPRIAAAATTTTTTIITTTATAAVNDVLVEAPVCSTVGTTLGSVNSDRAELSRAQASISSTVAMATLDLSRNSTLNSPQDHEGGFDDAEAQFEVDGLQYQPDIAIAPAAANAEEGVLELQLQAVDKGESTGRKLMEEFSIASITVEQMKIDGCNIVGLAGKDARDHYANGLKSILPANHRVSPAEDSSEDVYMFMYYVSKKSSNRSLVGCIFLDVGVNCEVITVYWLYTPPTLQHGQGRIGGSIVQKLFATFPGAIFELCAKREAAPFWFKMGFLPADQKIDMKLYVVFIVL